jgi:DNA-binding transcriptional regulator LsrR (DeoR family)
VLPPKSKKPERERYPVLTARQRDLIRFDVLEKFLHGDTPKEVAQAITEQRGIKISRESVYTFVREAIQEGFLVYHPPLDRLLTQDLQKFPNSARRDDANSKHDVRVVHAFGERASQVVSQTGAEITMKLIRELVKQRGSETEVHIAFGIGRTTMHLVENLAFRLRAWGKAPKLVVHAITPTLSMRSPLDTPVAAYTGLNKAVAKVRGREEVEFVNLEVAPFVQASEYARIIQQGSVKDALDRAREVDIVITSFADSCDEHGYLRAYLQRHDPAALSALEDADWLGDVHLVPYSAAGQIEMQTGLRPVTLFQLPQLAQLAASKDKHVVLLCAPCNYCGRTKHRGLRALLEWPQLRLWNHLIVDFETADALVNKTV